MRDLIDHPLLEIRAWRLIVAVPDDAEREQRAERLVLPRGETRAGGQLTRERSAT
jgi:hypothetical protein